MVQRVTKVGTRPQAGAKLKIVTGPKKNENKISLDIDPNNVRGNSSCVLRCAETRCVVCGDTCL